MSEKVTKTDNPDVSVIIPMYNLEKFIGQCLDSLKEQSWRDFEVICVDDGSGDSTCDIVKEYMDSDGRIRLVSMPHCGRAGIMRNEGLKHARGEYCLFLDGDDFFD